MTGPVSLSNDLATAGWALARNHDHDRDAITKTFRFQDFRDAIAWMVRAGFEAEAMNHHPEWRNVYNRVEVTLTTHDAGGLTKKDIELARRLERLAAT